MGGRASEWVLARSDACLGRTKGARARAHAAHRLFAPLVPANGTGVTPVPRVPTACHPPPPFFSFFFFSFSLSSSFSLPISFARLLRYLSVSLLLSEEAFVTQRRTTTRCSSSPSDESIPNILAFDLIPFTLSFYEPTVHGSTLRFCVFFFFKSTESTSSPRVL